MEPDPAQFGRFMFLVWVSLPLIFMGVASLINALVGPKMINGALDLSGPRCRSLRVLVHGGLFLTRQTLPATQRN